MPRAKEPLRVEPLSMAAVETIRRSYKGAAAGLVMRLAETVFRLDSELAMIKEKPSEPIIIDDAEAAYAAREKVLVVVEYDGMIEIYAERWVDVLAVELEPWDDPTFIEGLPLSYQGLHYANKLRRTAVAKMRKRPEIDEVLRRYAVHEGRMEAVENLKGLIEGLRQQLGAEK